MREARGFVGKGRPCTPNSPCCYPSLVHLEGREEEVSSKKRIFVSSEESPASSMQTPATSVVQLKYVSCRRGSHSPVGAEQWKLNSVGKMSDVVKSFGC